MASKENITPAFGKVGMNKDAHMSSLKQEEYTHAKNTTTSSEQGDVMFVQSEPSNILSSKFKDGFKVVGRKNDPFSDKTYYFLTNPVTKVSEIGIIKNQHTLPDLSDTVEQCTDCDYVSKPSTPLEDRVQEPSQVYETLINDECNNCLNFSTQFPIKTVEIKNEKTGSIMYFTDNLNPPRYIQLNELEQYFFTGNELCGDDSGVTPVCADCEKMLMFKKSKVPELTPEKIMLGGRLEQGTYEFLVAYSDSMGNETSRYFSITNPIYIFDRSDVVRNPEEIDDATNYAIKLEVQGLDTRYEHYKVAVIQHTEKNRGAPTYFVEGVHSTSDNTILYTTDKDKQRISLPELTVPSVRVDKFETIAAANGYLFGTGVTFSKKMNLQPVINLLSIYLNWQSHIANEDLYKDGIAAAKYKGYYRDETYATGIRFIIDGEYSPDYAFVGRPATTTDLEEIPAGNKDVDSVNKLASSCNGTDVTKRWQLYNTATELGRCCFSDDIQTNIITELVKKTCYIEPNFTMVVNLSGISGTATLHINNSGILSDHVITYNTDLTTTAADFATANPLLANGSLTVTSHENLILIEGQEFEEYIITIENTDGDLTGHISSEGYLDKLTDYQYTIDIEQGENFVDTITFIEDNRDEICLICNNTPTYSDFCGICEFLDIGNYPDHCAPEFDCTLTDPESQPELVREDTKMEVMGVIGENITFIERDFPTGYSKLPAPQNCTIYKTNMTNGEIMRDEIFTQMYGKLPTKDYWFGVRNFTGTNENCFSAEDMYIYDANMQYSPSYFHNYYGGLTLADVQTTKSVTPGQSCVTTDITEGLFTDKIHVGGLWFKKEIREEENRFIIEITPHAEVPPNGSEDEDLAIMGTNINKHVRVSFFESCAATEAFHCKIMDMTQGARFLVEKKTNPSGTEYVEMWDAEDPNTVITSDDIFSDQFFLVLDVPISWGRGYETEDDIDTDGPIVEKYRTVPTNGCFSVISRAIEYQSAEVTFKEMLIRKKEVYQQSCNYEVPVIKGCEAFPYKFGEFAYTESTETYPDNKDLYDSSRLEISPTDLPNDIYFGSTSFRDYFEDKFVAATAAEKYVWKEQDGKPITDFRCEPIRHFKFPDNTVSPFMYEQNTAGFTESIIYPLGMTIPEGVINSFLDIAVKNNLITQKQRDTIKGYEIVRGNRTANQTVVARGLAYDIREYKEKNDIISYSSYPFNDLGPDKLNYTDDTRDKLIPHPFDGEENYKWTLTSPETDYNKIDLPDFMKVDGYMYGKSRGQFDEIKGHPRWTILGSKLRRLASTLATTEVVVETAIITSQAFAHTNLQVGFVNTVVPGGIISAIALAIIQAFGAVIYKYGRYKYQWLTSFKNMGSPKNFAYYYAAEGYYNYFKPNTTEGEKLRFLNVAQNIGNARYQLTDSVGDGTTAEKIEINNTEREETVLLSTGKNGTIKYPIEYVNYDNGSVDFNTSSLTFSSENNECVQGKSASINRNVASMYVTLKNFLPSQYGTIGSIEWLTTGYRGDLENPKTCETTECSSVFGGDVFIARHTIKRSIPLFTPTAMDVPSLTPFEYEFYNNIGRNPKYYVNYELNTEDNQGGKKFPDIKSDFELDCLTGVTGNYIIPPSKFYVYYHGIPNFLTETTINTWNRTAKPEPWNNFYPNVGDFMAWTQEETNPIEKGNNFFYNNVYSGGVTPILEGNVLPSNYEQERFDMLTDMPNGTIYTLPDNSENSIMDPWLVFRPRDRFDFKAQHGKLIGITPIENKQVLGSFEDQTVIFDAVDTLVDDGQAAVLGDAGIFRRRPRTFANTDLGYMGTQTNQMLSTELGHFKVDAERGQIFRILPGGKEVEEISAQIGGNPSGMRAWFKEQLPFKIKKQFPDIDIDNAYNGVGITMGWDSKFKRVFITKKDYIQKETKQAVCTKDGSIYQTEGPAVENTITEYENQGYTYEGIEDCQLKFRKENTNITQSTDVFAFFDTTSMQIEDGVYASDALQTWFAGYQANNPTYTGSLYILPYSNEAYLGYPEKVRTGFTITSGLWGDIAILPPGWGTTSYTPPTDLLLLAFVDESQPKYHSASVAENFYGTPVQPSSYYTTDFDTFVNQAMPEYNFFRGVLYPIVRSITEVGGALVLQAMAAMKGTTWTQQEIDATGTAIDASILLTTNPYENYEYDTGKYLEPLEDYGWTGFYNKVSPASDVFNSQQFQDELNTYVNTDGTEVEVEILYVDLPVVDFADTTQFKDVSWTVSLSFNTGKWESFFDFKPNYYVAHNGYFQTGINSSMDSSEFGLWSHLLINTSYQVFYGKAYDWEIELPIQNQGVNKYLASFAYELDARRYKDEYDFAENKQLGFDEAIIFNNTNSSGKLNLELQKSISQLSKFPKTIGNTQTILQTTQDNEFRFNYFYNRVKNRNSGIPLWNYDENKLKKQINQAAVSFVSKKVLERIRGDYFLVNLKSKDTQHQKIFKILKTTENLYTK